jgi:transketolase
MTGVAAGLAFSGKIVFIYSIANFPIMRCLEQIRNDVCYHKANVKIVAVGGGLTYGTHGVTHQATEDLSIMRALPNMTVIAPGDPLESALATKNIVEAGPCYLRLGKAGEPQVHKNLSNFQIGRAITVKNGHDVTLISTGGMLYNTLQAAHQLAQYNIDARVLSMHTLKPLDSDAVLAAARETKAIVTVEEHSIIGGLGSAVAEVLADTGNLQVMFKRLGIPGAFCTLIGSQEYLRQYYNLSIEGIVKTVKSFISLA